MIAHSRRAAFFTALLSAICSLSCQQRATARNAGTPIHNSTGRLIAKIHPAGFKFAHDTYNGIARASDGKVYYVLCSDRIDVGAKMYAFDPASDKVSLIGDLTEAAGEASLKAVPQGKSHVNFVESNGKLYFATHIGYYDTSSGVERVGVPPPGYKPYPGGHFLSYDLGSGTFENLGRAPSNEGIQAFAMDPERARLYGLTWPSGHFLRLDLHTSNLRDFGPVSLAGEARNGPDHRTLCRSLQRDPTNGFIYFTRADGAILRYRPNDETVECVAGENMRKDYFGVWDPSSPGTMGYNWRKTFWYQPRQAIIGVHGNSGYLFQFDPQKPRLDVLKRITSEPSRRSGMYDQFSYGYLGFDLGPDGHTVYYLTGGPIYRNGKRVAADHPPQSGELMADEEVRLVTYDLNTSAYLDHGAVYFADGGRPSYCQSVAIDRDGTVYTMSRVPGQGEPFRTELISFKP